ncbi:MAG TPA: DinB family protein [Anaerolineae bacterium]|nr:DinB family protein [Anaerolineae bacterium]
MNQNQNLLDRLATIPARIARAVAGWPEAELHTKPNEGEWSAAAIFAHLRASDDILTPRLYAILVRDNPPLPAYDDRRWAEVAGYEQADFQTSLTLFTLRRAELVAMLRCIAPADWQRAGLHETHGSISILQIVTHLVEHEEEHCAQLEANKFDEQNR